MNQTTKKIKVQSIIQELNDDLSKATLSDASRQARLEQLKIYGRDPNGADAIYCKPGITTLSRYAFGQYANDVVQEALRVIANALLLQPHLQVALIEMNGVSLIAKIYQQQDDNFEFLGGRILFLCTYSARADFLDAFSAGLLEGIESHLSRHASQVRSRESKLQPIELAAATETAKLIFNLNNKYPEECKPLDSVVPDLCTILQSLDDTTPPLDPTTSSILNALACLDFGAVPVRTASQSTKDGHQPLLQKLVHILSRSIKHYKSVELDTNTISLITVLRMLYETSSAGVQNEMKKILFPADSERDLPLGQSSSFASQLLRLTTSPGLMHLPEAISELLFEMSNKDAGVFIRNIGYGYAAGHLMTHEIPIPDSIKAGSSVDSSAGQIPINPITGQRLDREAVPDLPEMTEEEKEQEAERLFVLFERLKATGVMDVGNPVTRAAREGRLG